MGVKTRPPAKQESITDGLRKQIISGNWGPGHRVPPRAELEQFLEASSVTIQRAFTRLEEDGFITVNARSGTYVAEKPPHLHHYVLSFPYKVGQPGWVRFWSVLSGAAARKSESGSPRISCYTGVEKPEQPEYRRLVEDVRAHRLAGLIFGCDPWPMEGAEFLTAPWLPRVAFMNRPEFTGAAQVALGGFDSSSFFEKAIKHLLGRGRRRIALLSVPGISGHRLDAYRKQLIGLGLTVDPCWIQTATQAEPQWATNLIMLLFKGKPEERPNGLIIADDNLVEHACAGLMQAGVSVPDDVDVVAHGNFPLDGPSLLPIKRLGYDIPAALDIALDLLQRQREGKKVPPVTVVPAVFEEEATKARIE